MHRIDDGDVAGMWAEGTPGTKITDDWMNDLQENVCQFIEDEGIALVKGTFTQLIDAVASAVTAGTDALKNAANTWALLQTMQKGLVITQSTANGNGLTVAGNGTGYAVEVGAGNLKFSASNIAATLGQTNMLSKLNLPKAFARITTNGAGAVTLVDGYNIASVAIVNDGNNKVDVTFADDMADTNYCVAFGNGNVNAAHGAIATNTSAGVFRMTTFATDTGSIVNVATTAIIMNVLVFGRQ